MWVVQEACVADTICFHCGDVRGSWPDFLKICFHLNSVSNDGIPGLPNLVGQEVIRRGWQSGERLSLRELIRECRFRCATDPGDKIYALLGLMAESMNPLFQTDYEMPFEHVYANAALHLITRSRSLDPIRGQQTEGRHESLPSWVPDFTLDQELAPSPLISIYGEDSIYHASGVGGDESAFHMSEAFAKSWLWNQLCCKGVIIDFILTTSEPGENGDSMSSIVQKWMKPLKSTTMFENRSEHITKLLDQVLQVVRQYDIFSNQAT